MPIADADKHVVEIVHKGSCAAGGSSVMPVVNVYHFRRTTTVNAWSLANIITQFETDILGPVLTALNVDFVGSSVTARCIDDATDLGTTVANTDPGLEAGDRLQLNSTVMLRLRTSTRGPHYRGRKYYSPISESHTTEEILNAAGITDWDAVAAALQAGFTDSDGNVWQPYVVSRDLSQLSANPTTVIGDIVVAVAARRTLGILSRRKPVNVY